MQTDGKILIGGYFTSLHYQTRSYLGRLTSDGNLDTTFVPNVDDFVWTLALQADSRILAGGAFTTIDGQVRNRIARLNPSGSLEESFHPAVNNTVWTLALQADGKILVGGNFTTLGGVGRNYIGRVTADGYVDATFNPGADMFIYSLALQADGKILVGGAFSILGGEARSHLGRLSSETAALQNLLAGAQGILPQVPDNTTLIWMRSGAGPQVRHVSFELSTDGLGYTPLGAGTRISGGWELAGLALPRGRNLWIRARGFYTTGTYNGSGSVVEVVRNIYVPYTIFAPLVVR